MILPVQDPLDSDVKGAVMFVILVLNSMESTIVSFVDYVERHHLVYIDMSGSFFRRKPSTVAVVVVSTVVVGVLQIP